ncbi:MAG TPA: agmatine deiminase family protein [Candidatus Acidoferrales bacterium]|nr:agmatine deiminase family protein [Candidatus Acidoferrales bacterium]
MSRYRIVRGTPAEHGYTFPAEWERQSATWLSWPRPEGISFPGRWHEVPSPLAAIVRAIAERQRVAINVPNANWERLVWEQLAAQRVPRRRVRFFHVPTNECWCRDHGPAFVVRRARGAARSRARRELAVVDWGYNAWGGKYPPFADDDAVPSRLARMLDLPLFRTDVVMEGGAVDFNGAGCVLTTESVLLNPNRNPGLSRRAIEEILKRWYGQERVLWLGEGIAGDDTDGHVDDLARFVGPRTIVTAVEDDPRDPNHGVLRENLRRLARLRGPDGRPFEIATLPMPRRIERDGQRLPATYLNFLFVNGALLVPTFGDRRTGRVALATLQRLLPRRRVIGLDCSALIWGLGAIHCLTQQQPAA